jgi:Domain of unknown function (DUF4259)
VGSWGTGAFDNDTAHDWVNELDGATDLSSIDAAFDVVLHAQDDYLEAPDAEQAIAAAYVIARLLHRNAPSVAPSPVDMWVEACQAMPSPDIIDRAVRALARVQHEPSELLELWSDTADFAAWQAGLSELSLRLQAGRRPPP